MVAPVENSARPPEDTVHRAREPGADRLHSAGERALRARLDEEVDVIPLEGIVQHAKLVTLTRDPQTSPELSDEGTAAKAREPPRSRSVTCAGQSPPISARSRWATRDLAPRGRPAPRRAPPRPVRKRRSSNDSCRPRGIRLRPSGFTHESYYACAEVSILIYLRSFELGGDPRWALPNPAAQHPRIGVRVREIPDTWGCPGEKPTSKSERAKCISTPRRGGKIRDVVAQTRRDAGRGLPSCASYRSTAFAVFARSARTASWCAAVVNVFGSANSSARSACCQLMSAAARISGFVIETTCSGSLAMRSLHASAASSRPACGTTSFTSPCRCASSAAIVPPRTKSSNAF